MTIGIDASRANRDQKTGTEWFSWHVIEELKRIAPTGDEFLLYTNEPLKGDLGKCPDNFKQVVLRWPPKYLWTQIRLWWELIANPPDVLFVPAHTIPFLPLSKKIKVIATVHDVGFKRFPEIYKPIQVAYHDLTMKAIRKRADAIITDSEFSKREIVELYGIAPERIVPAKLGYDKSAFNMEVTHCSSFPSENGIATSASRPSRNDNEADQVLAEYGITKPYVLFVGRIEKKKNVSNMVKALAKTVERFPDLQLVLAGAAGNGYDELQGLIKELGLAANVIVTGYVSDLENRVLTANADLFLFPTLYEGFGIPMLQAMACGTPVVASDMDIHREVAGEAAAFADPHDPEAISEKITRILSDSELRSGLAAKGLERAKGFSWRHCAERILEVITKSHA